MNYNIQIDEKDLYLDDHDLYLKLHNEIENKYETIPDFQGLQEQITREINLARNREICKICDGYAFLDNRICLECRGRGYVD